MNQDDFFQDDFFRNAIADFDPLDPMMDLLEKDIEQPLLPGEWRFRDKVHVQLDRVEFHTIMEPYLSQGNFIEGQLHGRERSNMLSAVESEIEISAIAPAVPPANEPLFASLKPGGVRTPNPPFPTEEWKGFPDYNPPGFGKVRSSRSGIRNSRDVYCQKFKEQIDGSRCPDCEYYDLETQVCRYGDDPEDYSED